MVSVSVTDETPLVHPGTPAESLTSTHSWTIETVSLPATVAIENQTVNALRTEEACGTITAGPDVTVKATGALTLRAGDRVVLKDGFRVEDGGRVVIEANPVFPQ
jgi:hypothetical protein